MPLTRMIMWLMMLMMTMMAMMRVMTVMTVSMGIYNQSEMMGLEVPIPWHLSTAAELSTITLSQVPGSRLETFLIPSTCTQFFRSRKNFATIPLIRRE